MRPPPHFAARPRLKATATRQRRPARVGSCAEEPRLLRRLIELNDGIAFSRNCVTQLAFSADDRFLAGTDDQAGSTKLAVWDMESSAAGHTSQAHRARWRADVVGERGGRDAMRRRVGRAEEEPWPQLSACS